MIIKFVYFDLGGVVIRDLTGYSLLADFVSRFEPNLSVWPVIANFKKYYPVGMLTNMYPGMFSAIKSRGLLPNVAWDTIIDSSIERCQKPDLAIYEIAQKRAGVNGDEILFIDNSPNNIKAAASLDWQTFLYDSKNPISSSANLLNRFL